MLLSLPPSPKVGKKGGEEKRGIGKGLAECAHAQGERALVRVFPAPAAATWRKRQLVPGTKVRPFLPTGGPDRRPRFESHKESRGCCPALAADYPLTYLVTLGKPLSFSAPQLPHLLI